tara:strand:+ start:1110 stop:1502 length:393 start_codon:yes stop_codon:yes gene_type:complete
MNFNVISKKIIKIKKNERDLIELINLLLINFKKKVFRYNKIYKKNIIDKKLIFLIIDIALSLNGGVLSKFSKTNSLKKSKKNISNKIITKFVLVLFIKMVGAAGFEPATLWSQTRCATRLRYAPNDVLIH